jgi:hypothetical protein
LTNAPVAQLDRATGFEAQNNHRLAPRIVIFFSIFVPAGSLTVAYRGAVLQLPWQNMAKPHSVIERRCSAALAGIAVGLLPRDAKFAERPGASLDF